jgi:protease-4
VRVLGALKTALVALIALLLTPLRKLARRRAVGDRAWVELELEGKIVRSLSPKDRARAKLRRALGRPDAPVVELEALKATAREIRADAAVVGVVVRVRGLDGGWALVAEVRDAIASIRATGRHVVVFAPRHLANHDLLAAAAGSHVLLAPASAFAAVGAASRGLFLGKALERLGLAIEVVSAGRYKSAPDALTRTDRSEADAEQTRALVNAIDAELVRAVASARQLGEDEAAARMDQAPLVGQRAVEAGLADAVCRDEELPDRLRGMDAASKDAPKVVPGGTYHGLTRRRPRFVKPRRVVGVVEVHGTILDDDPRRPPGSGRTAIDAHVVRDLRAALANPRIAAVVLSIDSRGGSVTAGDVIYGAVQRLADDKPVIACLEDVAASGGYYVACGANEIVASPLTVTGSIGVFAVVPTWPELMRRWEIGRDRLANRRFAGAYDPFTGFDIDERMKAEHEVHGIYELFLEIVAHARGKTRDEVHEVAQGRVWSGRDALGAGLVDAVGGFDEAVRRAKDAAGGVIDEEPVTIHMNRAMPRPDPVEAAALALAGQLGIAEDTARGALSLARAGRGRRIVAWWPGV